MFQSHVVWALIGMIGYSLTTLFVKLAMRAGISSSLAVAIATTVVALTCWGVVALRQEFGELARQVGRPSFAWAIATGIVLAIAVTSLFRALESGPASVVVPIYGMFIIGGAALAIVFLGEALTWQKAAGIAAAVVGVYLITA